MIYKYTLILFLLAFPMTGRTQHLIGLKRNDVIEAMKNSGFVEDNSSKNDTYNYMKYIDTNEDKTLLVFFSREDICTSTKMMCDYSSLKSTITTFNKKYKKVSALEWKYVLNNIMYKVILRKEEWFYSVIITPKSK